MRRRCVWLRQSIRPAIRRLLLQALLLMASVFSCGAVIALEPIKVGVLHSQTGTMAFSELPVIDATLLAVDELNRAGGLNGRQIEAVVVDGASDPLTFAAEAKRLISDEGVAAIFGGWTSASRKEMRPIVEKNNSLLFYPLQYEGLEESPNIVYLGAAPNQQLIPALKWMHDNRGTRFFLVGSDYIYPRCANAAARDYLQYLGGEIVGERYLPLGSDNVDDIVAQIAASNVQVIVSTINGDSNSAFFQRLQDAGLMNGRGLTTLSLSISENELAVMESGLLTGSYAAWNYFQNIDSPENARFVHAFRSEYGAERTVSDPMVAAYTGVKLWAQAVLAAGDSDAAMVRKTISNQYISGPQGDVYVDSHNKHTWKKARIGRVRDDGQFDIVWESESIIHPVPWPPSRSHREWQALLDFYQNQWQGRWANPGEEAAPDNRGEQP